MSVYGSTRPRRDDRGAMGPGHHYRRRRLRREGWPGGRPGRATFERVADPESLIGCYHELKAGGGHSPGPDGVTYDALGPAEVAIVLREAAKAIRRGAYRPGPAREQAIPKTGGGSRTLTIGNLVDRVVGAALNRALTPYFETVFFGSSYGFRPELSPQHLLADLMAAMAAVRITTLAIDDVKRAFDNVPIAPLMEIFAEHIEDASLLQLVETVLRGGQDRDRAEAIPQGSPLSPLALNVFLHFVHDRPLEGDPDFPPLFRFADNVCYLTGSVPEGRWALDHVRQLLAHAGLALKGADGDPVDLREGGEASLLGFRLSLRVGLLRLDLGEDALETDLTHCLNSAHDDPDPRRAARTALRGWVASHGPALGDLTENCPENILRTAARHGFRELASTGELTGWCTAAHTRWTDRYTAALQRLGLTNEDLLFVAAPPATVDPGGLP